MYLAVAISGEEHIFLSSFIQALKAGRQDWGPSELETSQNSRYEAGGRAKKKKRNQASASRINSFTIGWKTELRGNILYVNYRTFQTSLRYIDHNPLVTLKTGEQIL